MSYLWLTITLALGAMAVVFLARSDGWSALLLIVLAALCSRRIPREP